MKVLVLVVALCGALGGCCENFVSCPPLDISGQWTETGGIAGSPSTLDVENRDGPGSVVAAWTRSGPYPQEEQDLHALVIPWQRDEVISAVSFGPPTAFLSGANNVGSEGGTAARFSSRWFECLPRGGEVRCRLSLQMSLSGQSGDDVLAGDYSIIREDRADLWSVRTETVFTRNVAFTSPDPLPAQIPCGCMDTDEDSSDGEP